MGSLGKTLLLVGLAVAAVGLVLLAWDRFLPGLKPFRLPGDIVIRRPGFSFYFPVVTGLIISVILTILLNIFRK